MPITFGEKVINFNRHLQYPGDLPEDFRVINPFLENTETMQVMQQFYSKFYNDSNQRKFIIGINPGRHGAGVTGVPFTDTKRLESICGIKMQSAHTHEISSVFIYDMIEAYGGINTFYNQFYINSPFPLAIVRRTIQGKWVNANYYDDLLLFDMVKAFMVTTLKNHIKMGLDSSGVYVLGKKNATFIHILNKEAKLFDNISILDHPRYIQQYKSKEKESYIEKYLEALNNND